MTIEPLYVLSGLFVGFIVGLTGVGGGSLMTPLLVLFFGIHPATAVGTDLLFAAFTKSAGTLAHGLSKSIDWRIVFLLASGSVPASALTLAYLAHSGTHSNATAGLISTVLGIMLLITATSLLFRPQILAFAANRPTLSARQQTTITIIMGAALGALVSASSIGAGALGVTALIILYPGLPLIRIIGTDIAHAVPLTLVAGLGHWAIGSVDWTILGSLLLGSIPGILVASTIAPRVKELPLRILLIAILSYSGLRMLIH